MSDEDEWTDLTLTDSLLGLWGKIAVLTEDANQLRKWGVQTHTLAEWAVIIAEEEGELQKEMCEAHFRPAEADYSALRAEAIQVATLALKIARMANARDGERPIHG